MTDNQNDGWEIGGGGNSFPFDNVGDYVAGVVFEYEPNLPQTHISGPLKGQPRTFTSGQPMVMSRVGLHVTASSNPAVVAGTDASVYLKGALKPLDNGDHSTQGAVAAAIKATMGHNRLQPGAKLTLQYTSDVPGKDKGMDAKGYKAWYEGPSFAVGPDPTPPPGASAPTAAPVATPISAPPGVGSATTAQAVTPAVGTAAPAPAGSPLQVATVPPPASAATGSPGLSPEQLVQLQALQADAQAAAAPAAEPAWDSDPRVGPLRAQNVEDAIIRQVLGI